MGPKVLKIWTMTKIEGNKDYFQEAKGRWGKNECSDQLCTLAINGKDAIVGAQDGTIQVFPE